MQTVSGWQPEEPVSVPPLIVWPPNPQKIARYLFGFPGFYFPWIALFALVALSLGAVLQITGADVSRLSPGWIVLVVGFNLFAAWAFYSAWHHRLYGRRSQGLRFKYNPRWPDAEDQSSLRAPTTAANMFWSLGSGVPIWSAYEVLTLWAQARGFLPVTSWSVSPVYCSVLLLLLPFFHALHFYTFHRAIHWQPLYKTVHYLHHKNVNPSPWSGLAMHPVEHVVYFCGVLLLWMIPSTPFHVLFYTTMVGLAPVQGHSGFGKIVIGGYELDNDNYYHYLHHKLFKVNFGDNLFIPLDKLFGTFHDGLRRSPVSKNERI